MTNVEYQFHVAATAELGGNLFHGERSPPATALVALSTHPGTTFSSDPTPPLTTLSGKFKLLTLRLFSTSLNKRTMNLAIYKGQKTDPVCPF